MVLDTSPAQTGEPVVKVPVPGRVFALEFSPFEWSSNLLGVGLTRSILIGSVTFVEEDDKCEKTEFSLVKELEYDSRVVCLAWSPRTTLLSAPRCLQLAAAGTDHRLALFTSDINDVKVQELAGHSDYINGIVFDPDQGNQVVTASDDHTAKLWDTEDGVCVHTFYLRSPGMSVCWHPAESGKIIVAQKSGVVSVFNVATRAAILSLDCGAVPLLSADWCLNNSLMLAAAVTNDVVLFDLSRPSLPSSRRPMDGDCTHVVRLSRNNDSLVASCGAPAATLKVTHSKSSQTLLSTQLKVVGGLSWHLRLPYLAAGNDREISLYKISF